MAKSLAELWIEYHAIIQKVRQGVEASLGSLKDKKYALAVAQIAGAQEYLGRNALDILLMMSTYTNAEQREIEKEWLRMTWLLGEYKSTVLEGAIDQTKVLHIREMLILLGCSDEEVGRLVTSDLFGFRQD